MNSPTEKQIDLVEDICEVLNIDFPTSSKQYNSYTYYHFIKNNIQKYLEVLRDYDFDGHDTIEEDAFVSSYDFY